MDTPTLPHARLTIDAGGVLRDAFGRDVQLRGINCGGRAKWAPYLPYLIDDDASLSDVAAAADTFFARMPAWGLDTVRLTFSWEALEPERGRYDTAYLDRYEASLDAAWRHGCRCIVDFHQDIYSQAFSGDGFPRWTLATADYGPDVHDDHGWFFKYVMDDGVKGAYDRFWDGEDGLQDAFAAMWRVMVERFRGHPAVLGFEIINEPGWGSRDVDDFKQNILEPFHTRMAALLNELAPEHIVLHGSCGLDALGPVSYWGNPEGNNLMFAPHLYDPGLIAGHAWSGQEPDPGFAGFAAFQKRTESPILLGEFGVGRTATGGEPWFDRVMGLLDEHRMHATLWEYSINEELWNGEDLSVVGPDGAERPMLDLYVRPFLRAVAGTDISFQWDRTLGKATARWTATDGVTELALPSRRFPDGPRALEVSGAEHRVAPGALLLQAPAGSQVTVRFSG
jgi:endoglycosylceramidase